MTDMKISIPVEKAEDELRIRLLGWENYAKLDDYLIDDECGGFIRTLLYADGRLGRSLSYLTVTADNLMGYTRIHAFATGKEAASMEQAVALALNEYVL